MYFKTEYNHNEMKRQLSELDKELRFARRDEVSNYMKQLVIFPFMQAVQLSAAGAFEVLNNYFAVEYKHYLTFTSVEGRFV